MRFGERRYSPRDRYAPRLFLLMLLTSVAFGAGAKPEAVSYETSDGFRISAHYYRPDTTSSRAVLIVPGTEERKDVWQTAAESLRCKGFHTLVPDLRGTGESVTQHGFDRHQSSFTAREHSAAAVDGNAGLCYLRDLPGTTIREIALVGSGTGNFSVLGTDGDGFDRVSIVLLSPRGDAGDWVDTRARGAERPALIVVGKDDLLGIEATTAVLRVFPDSECWIVDGRGRGAELLRSRSDLIPSLISWLQHSTDQSQEDR